MSIKTLLFLVIAYSLCIAQGIKDSASLLVDSIGKTDSLSIYNQIQKNFEDISYCILDSISKQLDVKVDSLKNSILKNQKLLDTLLIENDSLKKVIERKTNESGEKLNDIKELLTSFNIERVAIGYEEGLSLRIRLGKRDKPYKKQFLAIAGFNYSYKNPSNGMQQKLHEGHAKIALLKEFAVFPKTRIAAYLDFVERFKQIETDPLINDPYTYNKYNMWISTGKAGVMLTVLSLKHFMFSFKFGLECSYYSPAYINNESNTTLMRINNGVFKWGINTGELSVLETLINNIGIYVYF